MRAAVSAIGLVFVFEGLVFALAPSRLDRLAEWMAGLSRDRRRGLGLAAIAAGTLLVWLSVHLAG